MKKVISLILAVLMMCNMIIVTSAANATSIAGLTDEYDVNSEVNNYGLDCDNDPMLCAPMLTGDFIQKWYCEYWTVDEWTEYFTKLKEAHIPMVIIPSVAMVSGGQYTSIGFVPDSSVSANMTSDCTGNQAMLDNMLAAAKSSGIEVMIGLIENGEWWTTSNTQDSTWYTREANLTNAVAKCIYDRYYEDYADVICGWYWTYEMWTCNSANSSHLETAWANMLNLTISEVNTLNPNLPIMICPYISKYYGTENALSCWKEFFQTVNFRDGDIIAPQDCFVSSEYDIAVVEQHWQDVKSAMQYSDVDIQFWFDVENFATADVTDYIKQLRICAKYATRLIAFSYAHYYAQSHQASLHEEYVSYANTVVEAENAETDTEIEVDTELNTDTETDTNTDTEITTESDADTEVETDSSTDINTEIEDTNTDTEIVIGSDTDISTETDIVIDTDISTETDIEIETDINGETDAETDVETDAETDIDTDTDNESILGDVNNDGFVDILDVVMVRAHIVGTKTITDNNMIFRADINSDNIVDIIDVVIMRNKIVNG